MHSKITKLVHYSGHTFNAFEELLLKLKMYFLSPFNEKKTIKYFNIDIKSLGTYLKTDAKSGNKIVRSPC